MQTLTLNTNLNTTAKTSIFAKVATKIKKAKTIKALNQLSDRQLSDIGLTRLDIVDFVNAK
ncbi:MAG: DUF1127 domain-containing protein [Alphaproteobacteria bacterium]